MHSQKQEPIELINLNQPHFIYREKKNHEKILLCLIKHKHHLINIGLQHYL